MKLSYRWRFKVKAVLEFYLISQSKHKISVRNKKINLLDLFSVHVHAFISTHRVLVGCLHLISTSCVFRSQLNVIATVKTLISNFFK